MKPSHLIRLAALSGAAALASAADPGWPRHYSDGNAHLVVHQPQVDSWRDFQALAGRCAFALTPAPGRETLYGTFRFTASTLADTERRLVLLRNMRAFDMRPERMAEPVRRMLPTDAMVVSLDRLLAYVRAGEVPKQEARVLTSPPPIFASTRPAVLVIVDGDAVMVDVENSTLKRVINTNWDLYQDRRTTVYYLRAGKSWLHAADLAGPYAPAADIPAHLARMPAGQQKDSPGGPPRVILVNKPAELIVTQGTPSLAPVAGTSIASVSNTESDLFVHSGRYYFLTSGRWFRAASLDGPWEYASASLPEDFKRIPPDHPRAHALAAVPGTREADDAVLLASIPRTAEVDRARAKADVQYVGAPRFAPVAGTSVSYATNTPSDVLRVGDLYYLCFEGVWFVSRSAQGPWAAAEKIPEAIYAIPESSPKYHVTYVRVYSYTPTTIVVGYTPGYHGAYVSGGVVVWGTGYYYPPYVAVGVAAVPVYWGAAYYTYGASAWYNPATAVYARGAAVYGPYGGYGAAAAYNPRTGAYAEGAAAWGPYGGAAAGRSYNPSTGTYSAGYKAANPYGSWGEGVVGNGANWAHGGYQSGARGTVAAGETAKGGKGAAFEGAGGKDGYVAKSASGDIYAGANGNVYKRDDGQWYQNRDGSWNAMDKSQLESQRQQAAARDRGNRSAQMAERSRPDSGPIKARTQGVERRPQFQGRRR